MNYKINIPKILTAFLTLLFFIFAETYALCGNDLSAESAVLIEQNTGEILFAKNENKKMKPASTTKILTGIIALEAEPMNSILSVSRNAAYTEGSSMYLKPGDKMKMEDIVCGLMLNSGNDAAVAISEHIGGNEKNFADIMNKKAKEIGARNSNFVTPNGLDDDMHYTTAYDLALIGAYAMKNEKFREMVSTVNKVVETDSGEKKYLHNHNKLLNLYEGCNGIKTGFTKASGRTLVSSAERDGLSIIAVTLKAPDDWNDHIKMLDYGFSQFEWVTFIKKNEACASFRIENGKKEYAKAVAGGDFSKAVKKEEADNFITGYVQEVFSAPIKKGERIGCAHIKNEDKIIAEIPLFSDRDIAQAKISPKEAARRIIYDIWEG